MERLWTKPFFLMTVATLFLFTAFYMLYPTLPLFIKQIGGNEAHVGWATGVLCFLLLCFARSSARCRLRFPSFCSVSLENVC
ncbi:hypothetical protein HNQ34_003242 [Anoxybacillus tepidamans]|uniref:Uncharacterized protein n=1 Tax=Anoxybacteroides tepidamans TaxID=265948 RepID=A0A7W8IUY0_9BACL|nr:hypothetical protein [Anoxybacillus tepidamans]